MKAQYDALKEFQVIKFQDRLNYMLNTLKSNGINIDIPEVKPFHLEFTDEIKEEKMNKVILENSKSAYSPYSNTIYIHESFAEAPQLEYHFTKRMLEHLSTKVDNDKIFSGVSIRDDKINYNNSLNQAITENIINTMFGNENIDEDAFKNYIIERHNLGLIESVVGIETIINAFLNSDYMLLENKFSSYGVNYNEIAQLMDKLTRVNYDISYKPNEEDKYLEHQIFKLLLDSYVKRSSQEKNLLGRENFESNIVNSQTVRGTFGTSEKLGYEEVNKNITMYNLIIDELEKTHISNKEQNVIIKR